LTQQTGKSFLPEDEEDEQEETAIPLENPVHEEDDDDDNPFLTRPSHNHTRDTILRSLPPPSHLPALIARIPTLSRPTVVVLDAFELFAEHPRQSLLYCLLDTAQSCRAGAGAQGLAVIGLTTRVDTINLLEKRVKSRFSGRMIRTAGLGTLDQCVDRIKDSLLVPIKASGHSALEEHVLKEWERIWRTAIHGFMEDKSVKDGLADTFALSKDARLLNRILVSFLYATISCPELTMPYHHSGICDSSDVILQPFPNCGALYVSCHHAKNTSHVCLFT
jgi:origin recognition complex subunit 4